MAEIKLRLNLDAEEVELVVDGEVALTSGKDVLYSWVEAVNKKNYVAPVEPASTEPVKIEEPVKEKEVAPEEPVKEEPKEVVAEVDTPAQPVVD